VLQYEDCFKKIAGSPQLTFEQLFVVWTAAESIFNSRLLLCA